MIDYPKIINLLKHKIILWICPVSFGVGISSQTKNCQNFKNNSKFGDDENINL